jgi:hypothetical protein
MATGIRSAGAVTVFGQQRQQRRQTDGIVTNMAFGHVSLCGLALLDADLAVFAFTCRR